MQKTYTLKPSEITRQWVVLDASTAPLGRIASAAAKRLIGKHKPTYTAHIDGGDYVIITNTDKLVVTGDKNVTKTYYRHSGYPGGLTETSLEDQRIKDSSKVIEAAVRGMLPKNKLQDGRLKRLKIYTGEEHTHAPQQPIKIGVND